MFYTWDKIYTTHVICFLMWLQTGAWNGLCALTNLEVICRQTYNFVTIYFMDLT